MPRKVKVERTWRKLCSGAAKAGLSVCFAGFFLRFAAFTNFPRLFAEELDDVARAGARLTEGDPAVPAQREFLAPQDNLLVALDGDEGAVRAVVGEDELVEATLDLAVRTRSHALL